MDHIGSQASEDLDEACRVALVRFRVEAFDNIDVEQLLRERPLRSEWAEWIGRHLLRHARDLDAYRAGQHILRLLKFADVA